MNPSDSPFTLVPVDAWSQELAMQVWEVDGGKIPPDEEPTEPPAASFKLNMLQEMNPTTH
jgi:hypothetical protein